MTVYFVSGLGADARVFNHVSLPDGVQMRHLDWLEPIAHESLASYAKRMASSINDQEPFALVGLSMGGMIVQEIATWLQPQSVFLISSVRSATELPMYMRWAGKVRIPEIIPISWLKTASLVKRFFTTESEQDKTLMRAVVSDSDPVFIRWALRAVLDWRHSGQLEIPIYHLHGSRDLLLPMRLTQPDTVLDGAGHMLVLTHASEVNTWLAQHLRPGLIEETN
jgi:pimeloyl-ACP methyl ester carboxylesterase